MKTTGETSPKNTYPLPASIPPVQDIAKIAHSATPSKTSSSTTIHTPSPSSKTGTPATTSLFNSPISKPSQHTLKIPNTKPKTTSAFFPQPQSLKKQKTASTGYSTYSPPPATAHHTSPATACTNGPWFIVEKTSVIPPSLPFASHKMKSISS